MATLVAVVEDDQETRDLVCQLLRTRGYTVQPYAELEEALEFLSDSPPDLLVTDIGLPDGSGLELIARLRAFHSENSFGILVLSGRDSESDILRVYAAGGDDFLSKPFSGDELLAKCAVLLARWRPPVEVAPLDLSGEGGLLFDRYVRLSSLGQGAFGTVYRAKDTKTGEIVALKVLSEEQGRHEEHRYRFLRETYALSAVKHANVVRVVDFGLSEGRLYYAMDCVEGVDLFMFVGGRNGVSEAGLVSLLKPVASALAAMHERNLVHRDLKPRNIMLRAGRLDDPVLIDFGLTKQSTDRGVTDPRVIMGTPGYIPPEVYGGTEFGPVGDLFSLGMVARFTLFGELWPELGAFDLMTRMIKQKVSVPPMGNEQLRELILRLLERDPKERFQSAAEVSTALADLQLDDADSQELPPTPQRDSGYDTTQTMRRRRPGVDAPTSEESE